MVVLSGCFQSKIVAPAQKNYILATQADICTEYDSRKVLSLFGLGGVAFNNDSSVPTLANLPDGKKVKFVTRITFVDYLVSALTFGIVGAHTIKTEVCQ